MRKTTTLLAVAALVGGLGAGATGTATADPTTVNVPDNKVSTAFTTGTGSNTFLDEGVYVRTRDGASEAAGVYVVNKPLAEVDSVSQDWSGTAEPGIRLIVDADGGTWSWDGTITFESVYGGNLWASSSSTDEFLAGAPHIAPGNGNNEGQGSQWYGTLAEWQAAYPDAIVRSGGWLLGLQGRGTLISQTFGDTTYTFTKRPTAKPKAYAYIDAPRPNIRRAVVRVGASQPDGTVPTERGAFYRVVKRNPRTDRQWTVGKGRVSEGDMDRMVVRFPGAKRWMQVRVISYGKVIGKQGVRMHNI